MSRPLRIEYPGAVYHVMNRGLNQNLTFLSNKDYEAFLTTLEEASRFFSVKFYSYCLMPNHYHILVCTPLGNISRFMRHLNGVYTQRFNQEHHRDGPLFRGRYKSILVQEDSYLIQVVRYIHKNPIKANMVERTSQFKWSSHKSYIDIQASATGLDKDFVLGYFSKNRKKSIDLYKRFMAEKGENDELEKFYSSKKSGSILGDMEFLRQVKEKYIFSDPSPEIEIQEKRRLRSEEVIRSIKKEICRVFKVEGEHLLTGKRGVSNLPRQFALVLSKELSGLKLSAIGAHFGFSSYRTVGSQCLRFQERMKQDKALRKKYGLLLQSCRQEWT